MDKFEARGYEIRALAKTHVLQYMEGRANTGSNTGSDQAILLCCCVNGTFDMLFLSLEQSFWH